MVNQIFAQAIKSEAHHAARTAGESTIIAVAIQVAITNKDFQFDICLIQLSSFTSNHQVQFISQKRLNISAKSHSSHNSFASTQSQLKSQKVAPKFFSKLPFSSSKASSIDSLFFSCMKLIISSGDFHFKLFTFFFKSFPILQIHQSKSISSKLNSEVSFFSRIFSSHIFFITSFLSFQIASNHSIALSTSFLTEVSFQNALSFKISLCFFQICSTIHLL